MRPVIVGLDNPHSDDPAKALGLDPVGGSGYRLWLMLKEAANRHSFDLSGQDYLDTFTRVNLFNREDKFDRLEVLTNLKNKRAILCGTRVPRLLGLRYRGFDLVPRGSDCFIYTIIPHPSGLCREYNDPEMRRKVGEIMFDMWLETKRL